MIKNFDDEGDSFSFWKNLILTAVFFATTPLVLGLSLFSLVSLSKSKEIEIKLSTYDFSASGVYQKSGIKVFASLPSKTSSIDGEASPSDARTEIVKKYLSKYDSPLTPFASYIVEIADKYHIDFRLLPSIAQQESNLCKVIPSKSYNCWGWGIYTNSSVGFGSYEEAIETVSRGLKEKYIDNGLTTPEQIMSRYTPASPGSWAKGVSQFMEEMQ
jgi:hypothetical protein